MGWREVWVREVARAICCGPECRNPSHCDATDASRAHLVDIHSASHRVANLIIHAYREWKQAGPMTQARGVQREEAG